MSTEAMAPEAQPTMLRHEVQSRTRLVFVDWKLNNFCNFRCSYCRPQFHEGTVTGPPTERVFALIDQIGAAHPERSWKHFHFTGGEPTAYEPLPQLLSRIKDRGFTTSIISNGSRPAVWWRDAAVLLDEIFFTFHVEMTQLRHLEKVLSAVSGGQSLVHVNVTMLPSRFDECFSVASHIARSWSSLSVSLKPLIQANGSVYGYTPKQQQVLKTWSKPSVGRPFTRRAKSQMIVHYAQGGSELLPASRIIARGLNRFTGWECNVGLETLAINADGKIFRGNCRVGGEIGTLGEGIADWPTAPVVCTKAACYCAGDICTEKRQMQLSAVVAAPQRRVVRLQQAPWP